MVTWIKGEPMPDELVDEILRGLGLERETDEQRSSRRKSSLKLAQDERRNSARD